MSDFGAYDLVGDAILQGDGKLLLVATGDSVEGSFSNPFLVRYNPNGTRDESFAPHGQIALPRQGTSTYYNSLDVLADGKMLLAGSIYYASTGGGPYMRLLFVRLNPDLSLDASFGTGGVATSEFTLPDFLHRFSYAMLADGKMLVSGQTGSVGTDAAIWRFNSDGTLDQTFASGGAVFYNYNVPPPEHRLAVGQS